MGFQSHRYLNKHTHLHTSIHLQTHIYIQKNAYEYTERQMYEDTLAQSAYENTPRHSKIIYTSHILIKNQKINAGRPLFFFYFVVCVCVWLL